MKAFFSGTDLEELNENSEFMNPYLSLIVNNEGTYCCKLAFRGQIQQSSLIYHFQDLDGTSKPLEIASPQEVVFTYDCDLFEEVIPFGDDVFENQVTEIMKPKPKPIYNYETKYQKDSKTKNFDKEPLYDWMRSDKLDLDLDLDFDEEDFGRIDNRELEEFYIYLFNLGSVKKEGLSGMDLTTTFDNLQKNLKKTSQVKKYAKELYAYFPKAMMEFNFDGDAGFTSFIVDGLMEEIEFADPDYEFVDLLYSELTNLFQNILK